VVVVWATVVVVVGGTVGAVSLFASTPPNVVQVSDMHLCVEPASLSTINAGGNPWSSKLNEANPSLYVPVTETSYVDVCQPVEPNELVE
jgi:hypothetical protein